MVSLTTKIMSITPDVENIVQEAFGQEPETSIKVISLLEICQDPQGFSIGDNTHLSWNVKEDRVPNFLVFSDQARMNWHVKTQDYHKIAEKLFLLAEWYQALLEGDDSSPAKEYALDRSAQVLKKISIVLQNDIMTAVIGRDEAYGSRLYQELGDLMTPQPFLDLHFSGSLYPHSVFTDQGIRKFALDEQFGAALMLLAREIFPTLINQDNDQYEIDTGIVDPKYKAAVQARFEDYRQELEGNFPYRLPSYAIKLHLLDGNVLMNEQPDGRRICQKKEATCAHLSSRQM